jgi:hypothetical protein
MSQAALVLPICEQMLSRKNRTVRGTAQGTVRGWVAVSSAAPRYANSTYGNGRLAGLPLSRRRDADVRTLRQGLGYCWSVAVAADPVAGLPRFRALAGSADRDVSWIVRENSKKARLASLV